MAVSARRGSPLTSEEIYMAALRLIDAAGVDALSMRKLAADLDVNPMSLYHHVPNKTGLLRGASALAGSRLRLPPDDGTPWQDQLRALAHAYRCLARAHPSLWSYVNAHPELLDREGEMWTVYTRILVAAGVPSDRLVHTRKVLFTFVLGFLTAEAGGVLEAIEGDADAAFDVAVELIIAGLEAQRA
ncbi:TetR/AcrR family transcriptional regulator C-terminal domain-containing protein [Sphaerisporangium sp. NPDC051017]|uniref:TetR/AcrR family transcriptional regulator n=1 Tax=Sphaerisporangium sp. NPDC051017 TaxID=3154636 RepID=UPI003433B344